MGDRDPTRGDLLGHLERHLGPATGGWRGEGPDGEELPLQVLRFDDVQGPDTLALVTLGLSHHRLEQGDPPTVRLELMLLATTGEHERVLPAVLCQVAAALLASHRAVRRGEVFGPAGPLVEGATTEALLASPPVLFDDEFAEYSRDHGDRVVIVWLVPVTRAEDAHRASHGHDALDDLFVDQQPDLLDLFRPSVTLPVPQDDDAAATRCRECGVPGLIEG